MVLSRWETHQLRSGRTNSSSIRKSALVGKEVTGSSPVCLTIRKHSQAATAAVCKIALFGVRRFESFCFHKYGSVAQ